MAPRGSARVACPRVDDYLTRVYGLLDDGKLKHLADLLGGGLTSDDQRDLVAAGVRLVEALEPGTFTALDALDVDTPGTNALEDVGASLLTWLAVEGPGAPYPAALGAARRAVSTCPGPPLMALGRAALGDEALARAVAGLAPLVADGRAGRAARGLRFDGERGPPALRALARDLLVVAASPDLSADELVALLAVVVDVTGPPWADVADAIRAILGDPALRADLASLSRCYRQADPDLALVDVLVDLLSEPGAVADALELVSTLAPRGPEPSLLSGVLADAADALLAALETDAAARRAVAVVVDAALAPDSAPGVLGDLAELLQAHVIGDVVAALHALATRRCSP